MNKDLDVYKAIATLEMSAMSDDKMTIENAEHLRETIETKFEEYEELKKVLDVLKSYIKLDESSEKGFPIIHWCDKYQLFALLQSKEDFNLLKRWLEK